MSSTPRRQAGTQDWGRVNVASSAGDAVRSDVVIVGAGIVGLATALALTDRLPHLSVTLIEKETDVGRHQTGHNSGVIHSGVYYRSGSLKAQLCVEGASQLKNFCRIHGIGYEDCGKVVVAVSPDELPRLEALYRQGRANGVPGLEMLDGRALRRAEPHVRGLAALHSPATAIVDYTTVARTIARLLAERGVRIMTDTRLRAITTASGWLEAVTTRGRFRVSLLVNCAGLQSDRVARLAGVDPPVRIIPFRGEYYRLRPSRAGLVRGLVYPVPNPQLPFLGVHLTRTVHGEVEAGPNAVLAFAREGYHLGDVSVSDLWETLTYRGFWLMARQWWLTGVTEFGRSLSRQTFARELRRLLPEVRGADLEPSGAGVRAQAVGRDGSLIDDFVIIEAERSLHVLNAPSPAATASLAIGHHIADRVAARLGEPASQAGTEPRITT